MSHDPITLISVQQNLTGQNDCDSTETIATCRQFPVGIPISDRQTTTEFSHNVCYCCNHSSMCYRVNGTGPLKGDMRPINKWVLIDCVQQVGEDAHCDVNRKPFHPDDKCKICHIKNIGEDGSACIVTGERHCIRCMEAREI